MNLKNVNIKALQSYKLKLKELKTWAQVKSPKPLQSALSYTLGWLSPELLGSGFRLIEISDFAIKGTIPLDQMNLDFNQEIHQGLVLNASLELARTYIHRHLPENFYRLVMSEIKISKSQKWNENISLQLNSTENALDEFFSNLQGNKKATIEFHIEVGVEKLKKFDRVDLKLTCEATNLLT